MLFRSLPVEKQVMIIYALTKGYLDDIPVEDVVRFEEEFHVWTETNAKDVLNTIRETGELAAEEDMNNAIEAFKKTFLPSEQN